MANSCLVTGINKDCSRVVSGGLKRVYLANFQAVEEFTADVDGSKTGVVMVDPINDFFHEFEFKNDTATITETLDNTAGAINTQVLTLVFDAPTQATINSLNGLLGCRCGLTAIVLENVMDENCDVVGTVFGNEKTEELFVTEVVRETGAAKGDANQITVTLTATACQLACKWTAGEAGIPVQP